MVVNMIMPEKILKVKMLGGFSLYYGGEEISLDRNTASKSMQLMQIMMVHKKDTGGGYFQIKSDRHALWP